MANVVILFLAESIAVSQFMYFSTCTSCFKCISVFKLTFIQNKVHVDADVVFKMAKKSSVECWTLVTLNGHHPWLCSERGGVTKFVYTATQAAKEAAALTTVAEL